MGLSVDDTTAIYKAYMYDLHNMVGTDTVIGEDGQVEQLNITNLNMNQYDTIFVVQNQYTPAFAQIRITKSADDSSSPTGGTVYVTVYRDSTVSPLDDKGKLSERISSVLRFTALIDETKEDLNKTNANDLYNHINSEFETIKTYTGKLDDSTTFVSAHGEGDDHSHEKSDEITVSIQCTADDWYTDADGNWSLNVYLYMSYDVQLVECFMNQHSDDKISLEDTTYNFNNDLESVSVGFTPSD